MERASYVACARALASSSASAEERERASATLAAAADEARASARGAESARQCALELLEACANSTGMNASERQTCGVVVARVLVKAWETMDAETKARSRTLALRAMFDEREGDRASMRAFVNVVDVLMRCAAMDGSDGNGWVELTGALDAGVASGERLHREASARAYAALCESLGDRMAPEHEKLLGIFVRLLSDQDTSVQLAALEGIGKVASSWCVAPTLGPALAECALTLVRGARKALELGEAQHLCHLLEAMSMLAGVRGEVYGTHNVALIEICELALRIATDPRLDTGSVRAPASLILTKLAKKHKELLTDTMAGQIDLQYDPHVIGQGGSIAAALVPPLLTIALESEEFENSFDEEFEGEGLDEQSSSPAALARGTLRALASILPNHLVVAPALNLLERLRASPNSPAAWKVLAVVTDGTRGDGVTSHLPALVPELMEAVSSHSIHLRVAATEVLCMLATHCQPELADEYAETVFGLITNLLMHAPRSCQWAVHGALSKMCENTLGESLAPKLALLVEALKVQTMDQSWRTAARATASIGALAECSLDFFTPHAGDMLALLLARAKSAGESSGGTELQARSIATMATILGVIGVESAPPGLLELLLQTAAAALTSTDTVARECAHVCLGKLAVTLEDRFEPFAIDAASAAVTALAQSDEYAYAIAVTTGLVEEQMAAADALGQYFNSGVTCLRQYLPNTLEAIAHASSPSRCTPLRASAIRATEFIFNPWLRAEKDHPDFMALCVATFNLLCERIRKDPEADVVLAAIQGMSELLDKAKSIATLPENVLQNAQDTANTIIRWQTVCQIEYEAREEAVENHDHDDESDDNDIFDTMVFWAERISPQSDSDEDDSD